jgi:hypothetical protein
LTPSHRWEICQLWYAVSTVLDKELKL